MDEDGEAWLALEGLGEGLSCSATAGSAATMWRQTFVSGVSGTCKTVAPTDSGKRKDRGTQ
jgi:hypothetical protein